MENIDNFPVHGILPKRETEALKFLSKYPHFDGRGVLIAILDTGVDPGAPGLQKTSDSKPKIIDIIDATGNGDVDISTVREIDNDGYLRVLSEKKLKIPKNWCNSSGKFYLGIKSAFDLYPSALKERIKKERKKIFWEMQHEYALANAQKALNFCNNELNKTDKSFENVLYKEEVQARYDLIKELDSKIKDPGPIYDCIVWKNSSDVWCACINTSENGNLEECQVLTNFKDSFQYGTFTHIDMLNYGVRIIPEENLLQIVTDSGSHGTHVASIAAGYFKENTELNGVAPGAQLLSIKIGDTRINGMETNYAIINAMKYVIEYKCHLINYSFGEPVSYVNMGPALLAFEEVVEKYGIVVCVSAGNSGPGLNTVGAPGGYVSSLISVGAFVSTEMLKAEHSVLGKNAKSMLFTWSSRGPSLDGSIGVSICAPGGAFASVPHWTLRGSQLMSGTSMASPNCCGSIALILSGLLAKNIEFYPYGIQRALENTALKLEDELGTGSGLIQIDKAFDYVNKYDNNVLNKIRFELKCGPKSTRGLFLKLGEAQKKVIDYLIIVEPKFFIQNEDKNKFFKLQNDKISFKIQLALICDDNWIECPKYLYMVNNSKQFTVRIKVDELSNGKFYFTQIKAYDIENLEKSCIFRVPITIIKPFMFENNNHKNYEILYNNVTFQQGHIERHFIKVPYGATHAEIELKCDENERDHAPLFYIQTFTFDEFSSYNKTEKDEIFRLNLVNNLKYVFRCHSNKIAQICICKNWSNIGSVRVDYSIKFKGLFPNNFSIIHFLSSEPCRIDINCLQDNEECEPSIQWKYHLHPLRPFENSIELIRNQYCDFKSIYQILLTYNFHQVKTSEICFESPLLSNILYESEYQSIFWILFDFNKRPICYGDTFPFNYKYLKIVDKGDYVIKVFVRHEKIEMLEKLKSLVLFVRQNINNIPQDIYTSYTSLLKGQKKTNLHEKVIKDQQFTIFLDSINDEKLPKGIAPGHFLKGELLLYKDNRINKIDYHDVLYEITDYTTKKSDKLNTKTNEDKDEKSEEEKLNDAIRDLKISWVLKSNEIFEKLLPEYNNHIPLFINRIKYLEQQLAILVDNSKIKLDYLSQIIELSKIGLSKINQNELFCYFGVKKHDILTEDLKKDMEMQKNWVIDLLSYQGVATADMHMIQFSSDTLEILKTIYKSLQKLIDINDEKASKFLLKFCMVNKYFGRALKILFKQNDEKPSILNDKLILDAIKELKLDYIVYFYENEIIIKYPKTYTKF